MANTTTKKKASTRRKATSTKNSNPEPEVYLMDANGNVQLKVLDVSAVFFIQKRTGEIDVVAKERTGNVMRKQDGSPHIWYHDRGIGFTGPDDKPELHVTIEEVEELVEELDEETREEMRNLQNPPEAAEKHNA